MANEKQEKEARRRALDKAKRNKKVRKANRERNIGIDNEHSRNPKGNKKTGHRNSGNQPRK